MKSKTDLLVESDKLRNKLIQQNQDKYNLEREIRITEAQIVALMHIIDNYEFSSALFKD